VEVLLWIILGAPFAATAGTKVCSDAEGMEKHFDALVESMSLLMVESGAGENGRGWKGPLWVI